MSDIGVAEIPVDEDERPLPPPEAPVKNALLEHGVALPSGSDTAAQTPEAAPPRPPAPIPPQVDASEHRQAEIDRIVSTMERWWRRVVELAAAIQRDLQGKD